MLIVELGIIAALIILNGLLALSELAVVSSRRPRLKAHKQRGVSGAGRALALAEDPGRFLSTVQIGITLVGVLSGAFSGATVGQRFANWLAAQGLSTDVANQTAAVTLPGHRPSAEAWGARLASDAYYADPNVFKVEADAAAFSHPGYVSLRFSVSDAIAKVVVQPLASGGTVEGALPALQTELVNLAKLNGYQVE